MNEHTNDPDADDADEENFDSFEEAVDSFIEHRFRLMESTGTHYRTRDAFIGQTLLLIEISLLGISDTDASLAEMGKMVDQFSEDGWAPVSKPNKEWCQKVVKLAVEYIKVRRADFEREHHERCQNCNPVESRSN